MEPPRPDFAIPYKIMAGTTVKKNSKFIMSNAKVELVANNFPQTEYKIVDVTARRAINSKNPEATTTEVLIMNYN